MSKTAIPNTTVASTQAIANELNNAPVMTCAIAAPADSLASFISIKRQYLKSVRIDSDIHDPHALDGYIPIFSAINMLNIMCRSIMAQKNCAFTWSGAFGSGKSTLALLFAALCGDNEQLRARAYALIKDFKDSDGNNVIVDLFCSDLMVKTASMAADEANVPIDINLAQNNSWKALCLVGSSESLRHLVHLQITQYFEEIATIDGANNKDLAKTKAKKKLKNNALAPSKILNTWVKSLQERNEHIMLIIDELGKFLTNALQDHDIYFLQELAEAAARSKGHLVILGIMHQSFDAYISGFNKQVREEWVKVQGRFDNIILAPSIFESLKIISNSFDKHGYKHSYSLPISQYTKLFFSQSQNYYTEINEAFSRCLPLHPLVVILLCSLSKKSYGQNARSIFGFLNSFESFSFASFLASHNANSQELYLPNHLFDYILSNQNMLMAQSKDGHLYMEIMEVFARLEKSIAAAPIALYKTICMIELLGKDYAIYASKDLLSLLYEQIVFNIQQSTVLDTTTNTAFTTIESFDEALDQLLKQKAVLFKSYINAYGCFIGSDFDFDAEYAKAIAQVTLDFSLLKSFFVESQTVVAKRYYMQTGILRYLELDLLSESQIQSESSTIICANDSMGKIFLVLREEEQDLLAALMRLKAKSYGCKNIVFALDLHSQEIMAMCRSLQALKHMALLPALEGDGAARKEIAIRIKNLEKCLQERVHKSLSIALFIYDGEIKNVSIKLTAAKKQKIKEKIQFFTQSKTDSDSSDKANDIYALYNKARAYWNVNNNLIAMDNANGANDGENSQFSRKKILEDYLHVQALVEQFQNAVNVPKAKAVMIKPFDLCAFASDLAEQLFPKAVYVHNELINRNKISSQASKARNMLMQHMVLHEHEAKLGFTGTPAEVNLYWTILYHKKLHRSVPQKISSDSAKPKTLATTPQSTQFAFVYDQQIDDRFLQLFEDTIDFIRTKGKVSAKDIYDFWTKPPYGLKNGICQILLLYLILVKQNEIATYDKGGIFVTNYDESFVDDLLVYYDSVSLKYVSNDASAKNILNHVNMALKSAKCNLEPNQPLLPLLVARKLVGFYLRLPPLTKRTFELSPRTRKLRGKIEAAKDPINLLFVELPAIYTDLIHSQASQSLNADINELMSFYTKSLRNIEALLFKALQFDPQQGIEILRQRANNIKGLGNNSRQEQFITKLANYTKDLSGIESMIAICSERPQKNWTDSDIQLTQTRIPELAMEFRKTESFAGLYGRDVKRSFFSIITSTLENNDIKEFIELSEQKLKDVDVIAQNLEPQLKDLPYEQALGVLARLASLLKPNQKSKEDKESN